MATKTVQVSSVLVRRAREQVEELRAVGRTPSPGLLLLADARPAMSPTSRQPSAPRTAASQQD